MKKMEIRSLESLKSNGEELRVEGLVNKTGSWSRILGGRKKFRERVLPGVFSKALEKAKNIDFLAEHNRGLLLASTQNNSLELWEDNEGLQMKAIITPTSYGKDIFQLVKSGLKTNMSFGMQVLKESWSAGEDGIPLRTIEEIELTEVSAVRNPCYVQSSIEARGIDLVEDVEIPENIQEEERSMEKELSLEELKAQIKAEILEEIRALNKEKLIEEEIKEELKEEALEGEEETKEEELDKIEDEKDDIEEDIEDKIEEDVKKEIAKEHRSEEKQLDVKEEPKIEEPKIEEPKIEESKVEESKVDGAILKDYLDKKKELEKLRMREE